VITVYNAVEPVAAEVDLIPQKKSDKKVISFLGRITMQKGPEYFLEAASLVLQRTKDVRFIMAGKGDMRDAMIRRAAELNIADFVDFPGFIPDDEVHKLFQKSDIFVMPSVSEPFGIVTLEAMQNGVPVIISKQSGASEILENAVKVDYWDVHQMANAITDLVNNQAKRNMLGKLGKKEANKLLWKNSAERIRQIYINLPKDIAPL
jgi:glycosyltransferase involved in cell wall biosynthesis